MAWLDEELEVVSRCPVCFSADADMLYEDLFDGIFDVPTKPCALRKCKQCGSAYLNPRPKPEAIFKAYDSYYTHESNYQTDEDIRGAARRLKRALANGYRNQHFSTHFKPALKLGALIFLLLPEQRLKIERGLRNLPRLQTNSRVLDVGFGDASFLQQAKKGGWEVAGADPDSVVVENAQKIGLDVRAGGIEAFSDSPSSFDVITLSNVIEHLHDPREALIHAYKLLKPGGYLWMDTPNINGPVHALFGKYWRGLEPPRHLAIFSVQGLESLVETAGFENAVHLPYVKGLIGQRVEASKTILQKAVKDESRFEQYQFTREKIIELEKAACLDVESRDSITLMCRKPYDRRN